MKKPLAFIVLLLLSVLIASDIWAGSNERDYLKRPLVEYAVQFPTISWLDVKVPVVSFNNATLIAESWFRCNTLFFNRSTSFYEIALCACMDFSLPVFYTSDLDLIAGVGAAYTGPQGDELTVPLIVPFVARLKMRNHFAVAMTADFLLYGNGCSMDAGMKLQVLPFDFNLSIDAGLNYTGTLLWKDPKVRN
ncbi:MAG: hypothetical protein J5775_06140, partial [Spirochaetales bacterium]|nr:hypothetical protein [Spirochaetales bacterium]